MSKVMWLHHLPDLSRTWASDDAHNNRFNRSRGPRGFGMENRFAAARLTVSLRGFLKALMDARLALLVGPRFGGAC